MILVSGAQRQYRRFFDADSETKYYLVRHRYIPWFISQVILPIRFVLAVLLRGILLALKPVVHIRFGRYVSVSIGAWVIPMELYLCQKSEGLHPKRSLDLFYHWNNTKFMLRKPVRFQDQICNTAMHAMFKRKVHVHQFASALDGLNRMLPGGSQKFTVPDTNQYDPFGDLERALAQLNFTEAEERYGQEALRKIGIEPGMPFACFYARDGVFITRNEPPMTSLYGERDENLFRNADVKTYIPAAEELANRGYLALRMGKWVEEAIETDNPKIIDYAYCHHSDFLDVYLAANCTFFIGTNGGIIHLPSIFRRPMGLANVIPLVDVVDGCADTVSIAKKFYSNEKGRLLTFREILSEPLLANYSDRKHSENPEFFDPIGLEVRPNTSEEILELVVEMDERVKGAFQPTQEDWELQQRYISILEENRENIPPFGDMQRLRMGAHFLRSNPALLD